MGHGSIKTHMVTVTAPASPPRTAEKIPLEDFAIQSLPKQTSDFLSAHESDLGLLHARITGLNQIVAHDGRGLHDVDISKRQWWGERIETTTSVLILGLGFRSVDNANL